MVATLQTDTPLGLGSLQNRVLESLAPIPAAEESPSDIWNRLRDGLANMRYYAERSRIQHGADPADVDIDLGGEIVVGKFVDIEKPVWGEVSPA